MCFDIHHASWFCHARDRQRPGQKHQVRRLCVCSLLRAADYAACVFLCRTILLKNMVCMCVRACVRARVCACVCLRALALFRVSLWMLCSRTSHWVSSGSGSLASRSSMRARPETGMAGSLAGHRAGSFPVQLTCLYHSGPAGVVLAVAGRSRDVLCVRPQVYVRVPAHVLHHNNDHHQRCCRFEVRNQGGGISLPLASPPYAAESSESRLKHTSRLDL